MRRSLNIVISVLSWLNVAWTMTLPPYPENSWSDLSKLLSDKTIDPDWRAPDGRSIVLLHMLYGSESTAVELLKRAKRVGVWREGTGRLMNAAVTAGSQQIVQTLLSFGESPNAITSEEPPLLDAVSFGKIGIMRMLLHAGANIYANRPGTTLNAMDLAMERGSPMAVNLLIDNGFDLSRSLVTEMERSLVLRALEGNCIECLEVLRRAKFEFSKRRTNGETPLTYAVSSSVRAEMVEILLGWDADPCIPNSAGKLPEQLIVPLEMQDLEHPKPMYSLKNACKLSKLRKSQGLKYPQTPKE